MRVLLTTDTIGGVWTFTRELTEQLLIQGHCVALVGLGRAPSTTQSAWVDAMTAAHSDAFLFDACDVPLEWMQDNARAWAEGAALLVDVAKRLRADILHSSQFCWGSLPLDVPKVITAHSDVRSWAAACRVEMAPSSWLDRYDLLVQDGTDGADAIVAPTAWMRDALRVHFPVAAPFHVIPNGRTISGLEMEGKRELRAVSVGRLWDEGKGLFTLREMPCSTPVLLAGECSFEGAVSRDLANVTALGLLDEKALFELFSTSSVYLATSLYEPFGLAPLEAALCGCAIVARDLPSFREVWGDAALYFKDAAGLRDMVAELVSSPAKLRMAQGAAAERARGFSGRRMAEGYASLYGELIAGATRGLALAEEGLHAA